VNPVVRALELELDNFKSFGNKVVIPFGEGFTTISGPNGSGKSNILDSILYVLGLTTSKALRAERLPDLINNKQKGKGYATVAFRLSVEYPKTENETEQQDSETIEIRRTVKVSGDNYTSTYYLNGTPQTLSRVHEELSRIGISPRGNNIILQGDVTRITTMSPLERRRVIDDLAGIAEFDGRIEAAQTEMDKASRHMEDLGLVADEIAVRLNELSKEKERAFKYGKLRDRKEELEKYILLAEFEDLQRKLKTVRNDVEKLDTKAEEVKKQFPEVAIRFDEARKQLAIVDDEIREKGEDEKLKMFQSLEETKGLIARNEEAIQNLNRLLSDIQKRDNARMLEEQKASTEINSLNKNIQQLGKDCSMKEEETTSKQKLLKELYSELDKLSETTSGDTIKISSLRQEHSNLSLKAGRLDISLANCEKELSETVKLIEANHTKLSEISGKIKDQNSMIEDGLETRTAILEEKDNAQRRVDGVKWETARVRKERDRFDEEIRVLYKNLATEEAQAKIATAKKSSRAITTIIDSSIKGIHGTVGQLCSVPSEFTTAAEVAAGRRLDNIVVSDEHVAAQCIDLLKREKAGRLTFLPINKIKGQSADHMLRLDGTDGYLVDLISFKPRYENIFAYIFGTTVVVRTLSRAKELIGQFRMVTKDGELIEKSGAMTGGSLAPSSGGRLAVDLESLRRKLQEKEEEGKGCMKRLEELYIEEEKATNYLEQCRKNLTELDSDIQKDNLEKDRFLEIQRDLKVDLKKLGALENEKKKALEEVESENLKVLLAIEALEEELSALTGKNGESRFDQIDQQTTILEREIRQLNEAIRSFQEKNRLATLEIAYHQRNLDGWKAERAELEERKTELGNNIEEHQNKIKEAVSKRNFIEENISGIADELALFRKQRNAKLEVLEAVRSERLELEAMVRSIDDRRVIFEAREAELIPQLEEVEEELSHRQSDVTTVPPGLTPSKIRRETGEIEEEMKALEPVNMRALEQYDELSERHNELGDKLSILQEERKQLRSRMTSFGRQKFEAFMSTFRRIKENYETIYEELSDGEGVLLLDDEEDPFAGGLAIKAKPRGKNMTRLEALSGGEKSLAALAFVFAFQSHNPAPFYVFDEVDMFLDGCNTERLAKMISNQSSTTQFLVVSLRKAMIERSHRTIGVTQTKKGFSQVTGLELPAFIINKDNSTEEGKHNVAN
jgi:chromosome segregation protein